MHQFLDSVPPVTGPTLTPPAWGPPGLPAWGSPPPPPFRVHTSGGSTTINLFWESLRDVAAHVKTARDVLDEMQSQCSSAASEPMDSWAQLNWRIPVFHARIRTLGVALGVTGTSVDGAVHSVQVAEDNYRNAENSAQRVFELLVRLDERQLIAQHALHPHGDDQLVYDWAATTGVLSAGLGVETLAMRYPGVSTMLAVASAADLDTRLTSTLLDRYEQSLDPQPTATWQHQGDGTLHHHLEYLAEVSEHGDMAVSEITTGEGEPVYTLFIAGFNSTGEPLEEGRGPLSFMDAWSHESEHTAGTIEAALDAAGVPEGATVVPIGYSMGGAHVINLVSSDRFTKRYDVPAAATIGSPGKNTPLNPGVKMTHLEDARDPTARLRGEANQQSADRLTISYESHPAEGEQASALGSRHALAHNTEAFEIIENDPSAFLSPDEIQHLDALREPLRGSVETSVYRAQWAPRESAVTPLEHHSALLTDAEYFRHALQGGMDQVREAIDQAVPVVPRLDTIAGGEQEPVQQGGDH